MAAALLRDLLAAGGCYALWRLWRRWFANGDARVAWIAGAGFLLRAFLGQALFWISYLTLPIGRSLQRGDGLWFYAEDGWWYMGYARDLVRRPLEIFSIDARYPSRAYVQLLSAFVGAFGDAASVALFLNCAAYLATCALVVRLQPRVSAALLFALAAVAFGPGMIIWSLQPLKDTVFTLVIAALVFVCARWQARWSVWQGAAIIALLFAAASIRWYFGVIVWALVGLFFLITLPRARRRGWAVLTSAAVFLLASQAVRIGGGADVQQPVERMLNPRSALDALRRPAQVTQAVTKAQKGFEHARGATTIAPGPVLEKPAPPPVKVARAKPKPKPELVPTATVSAKPETAAPPAATTPAAPAPAVPKTKTSQPPAATPPSPPTSTTAAVAAAPAPQSTTNAAPAPAPTPRITTTAAPAPVTPKPATKRKSKPKPKPVLPPAAVATGPPPVQPPPVVAAKPTPALAPPPAAPPQSSMPRLLSGVVAAFVPRFVAQPLGLIRVGGGRGLWLFAEADTLAFDAVLLVALVFSLRARRRVTPLFVLVLLVIVTTAGPMIYTVNNFGTLFRLRGMLYFLAAVLPVTLAPDEDR